MLSTENLNSQIIEKVFFSYFKEGVTQFVFEQEEIWVAIEDLHFRGPEKLDDIPKSFRQGNPLPSRIRKTAPSGYKWVIQPVRLGGYRFILKKKSLVDANPLVAETKIIDVMQVDESSHVLKDIAWLLLGIRMNRLIDVFTGLTCYSVLNYPRALAKRKKFGTKEIYIGLDRGGIRYVLPLGVVVENDTHSIANVREDFLIGAGKFPGYVCKPITAQLMANGAIALFELVSTNEGIAVASERHYRLVRPEELSIEELESYKTMNV